MTQATKAAARVLEACLQVTAGTQLLVVFDDSAGAVGRAIIDAATTLRASVLPLFFPARLQQALSEKVVVPSEAFGSAIEGADAVITALSNRTETTQFRIDIVNGSLETSTRIAHMPGISEKILASQAETDYAFVFDQSEKMKDALANRTEITILTEDASGGLHTLQARIENRSPMACGCLVEPGGITNIPCGEAFVAPIEDSGTGSIVISGSIPGLLVPASEELILEFAAGQLTQITPEESVCGRELVRIRRLAEEKGWKCWDVLAEIGIGTNPWVQALTGVSLVDEKKSGTVHIAIGENSHIGGVNEAPVHLDLVTYFKEIRLDGEVLPRASIPAGEGRDG